MAPEKQKVPGKDGTSKKAEGKPRLLFVDHAVPQYDVYAGSRTNFMYLHLLLKAGFDITFLAENFLELEPYTSELRQMGVEVLVGDQYRDGWRQWISENGASLQYVFLHKPDPAALFLPEIRRHSEAAIIYQCHDLHYLRLQRKAEIEADEAVRKEAASYEEKEDFIFANSDVLLTFSDVEERVIREKFPHKPVFTVPLFFYQDSSRPASEFSARKDLVFVGACAHSPNHDAVTWFCKDILPLVKSSIPGIAINIVGANPPPEIEALASSSARILGKVSEDELQSIYLNSRVMVVPLRFGAGVKGKVIEAMHNGLPLVSTSIGLEGIKGVDIIYEGRDTAEAFAEGIISLYQDGSQLSSVSHHGAQFVDSNFGFESTGKLMDEVFKLADRMAKSRVRSYANDAGTSLPEASGNGSEKDESQHEELEDLRRQLEISERKIEELLGSTSWKLTAPGRWLKQLFQSKNRH